MTKPNELPDSSDPNVAGAITLTVLHFVLWTGLLLILLIVVPRFVDVFYDFDVELPSSSKLVVQMSHVVAAYWYLFVLFGLIGLVLDFGLLLALRKRNRLLAGVLLTFVPLSLGAFIFLGIGIPMTSLMR
jgi:type II secretory pathway component PulF